MGQAFFAKLIPCEVSIQNSNLTRFAEVDEWVLRWLEPTKFVLRAVFSRFNSWVLYVLFKSEAVKGIHLFPRLLLSLEFLALREGSWLALGVFGVPA